MTMHVVRACAWFALAAPVAAMAVAGQTPSPAVAGIADQFTLTLADGWSVYDQNAAVFKTVSPLGLVWFTAEPITEDGAATVERARKAATGEIEGFFVDRQKADGGMACSGLSRNATYDIKTMVNRDATVATGGRRLFGGAVVGGHTDIELGGCRGFRFVVEAHKGDAAKHRVIDVRVVSDGQVLYVFSLRNEGQYYERNRTAFERALATLRFVRQPPPKQ